MRCSCCCMCFSLILGDITEQITASFSIPWISFYQILSVLEILLSQLHVSFVIMRQAQYDEMSNSFDLGFGVFYLLLVLPCCVILDMECHPCASWHSSACHCFGQKLLSRCTNPTPIQQVSVPSKLWRYCSNRKCGPVVE